MSYKGWMPNAPGRSLADPHGCDSRETPALRFARHRSGAGDCVLRPACWRTCGWWVQPALIYSCGTITNFPIFHKGWSFFAESVRLPGGLVQYVSAFASQLFYYSWAGAAVIAVQAWAICCLCRHICYGGQDCPGARLLGYVPAILMLVAYAQYSYHLPLFMGALASVAFASLYVQAQAIGQAVMSASYASGLCAGPVHHRRRGGRFRLPFVCIVYELAAEAMASSRALFAGRARAAVRRGRAGSSASASSTPTRSCCPCPGGSSAGAFGRRCSAQSTACIWFPSWA